MEPAIRQGAGAPCWVRDLPDTDYHADLAISSTMLKTTATKTPAHAKAQRDGEFKETPALLLGRAVHAAILEPERYPDAYLRAIEGDGRTKAVKEARAAQAAEFPDATILPPADFDLVEQIAASVCQYPLHAMLLNSGEAELSGFWTDPETGLACRIRPDYTRNDVHLLVDLKTTLDAAPAAFQRSVAGLGYAIQAAFYMDGYAAITGEPCKDFVFLTVEKAAPFAVAAYRLDDTAVQYGRRQYRQALRTLAHCMETDTWPGYPEGIEPITLPEWAFTLENLTDENL